MPDQPIVVADSRVLYEKRGHVAYITLNRPEVLNALDTSMHAELCAIWDDFEQDDEIWLGVLGGAGTRAFSVGQDMKELVQRSASGEPASSFGSRGRPGFPRLTERFSLSKPLVAKVQGYALGGGFELALACDIIVASEDAFFGLPEAKLGLIAGAGGVFRLLRQAPLKIAMGYLMTGRHMSAATALGLGLVNQVVPSDLLDQTVEQWLEDLLSCAPLSLRSIKEVSAKAETLSLSEAFDAEYEGEARRRQSRDCTEGPIAFVQKRPPVWTGT
jgi:crotonobetainyl-CoA hydratase/dehydration protein DpgD